MKRMKFKDAPTGYIVAKIDGYWTGLYKVDSSEPHKYELTHKAITMKGRGVKIDPDEEVEYWG